jgi:hypothetical protein
MNFGVGYRGEVGDLRIRASVDFFSIEVTDSVVTTLATTVIDNVFHTSTTATNPEAGPNPETNPLNVGTTNYRADCSARLVSFIAFNGGCVQGTTNATNIAFIRAAELNGPGFTTEGLDYTLDLSHPLLDGDLGFSTTITQNTKYQAEPFYVNGVLFDLGGDRLGYRNADVTGSASQRLRGNASLRWSNDQHVIALRANYVDGYKPNPNTVPSRPIINNVAPTPDILSDYGFGRKD